MSKLREFVEEVDAKISNTTTRHATVIQLDKERVAAARDCVKGVIDRASAAGRKSKPPKRKLKRDRKSKLNRERVRRHRAKNRPSPE